jgi:hypothetical protein
MASPKGYKRNYTEEEKTAKARGETGVGTHSGDAVRHRARRELKNLGMVKPDQDVDHKDPLSKGGSETAVSNLRAESVHKNRSYPRTKRGAIKP